jgi:serine/threonine protein kinase
VSSSDSEPIRLGGVAEVVAELGLSRQRLSRLRERPDFPAPIGEIRAGPVWDMEAVRRWNQSGLRRPPGRPERDRKRTVVGGRYELERVIGSGGFADVYRSIDLQAPPSKAAVVAVKVLRDDGDDEVRRRFLRELRLLETLEHPNVVSVLAHGVDGPGAWYAMPLATGNLAELIDRVAGDEREIFTIVRQLAAGLAYIHDSGVYHRDLKPANALYFPNERWAISDFGLAREADRQTTALTSTLRQGFGTFHYAAPEQWQSAKHAGHLADVFSLGKILQALVTGMVPVYNAELPGGIYRPVIYRATRPRPEDRYPSVAALLDDLHRAVAAPKGHWQTTADALGRLRERLRVDEPDETAFRDLLDLAVRFEEGPVVREGVTRILAELSPDAIRGLWTLDPEAFRDLISRFAAYVAVTAFDFAYTDVLADLLDRAVTETRDDDVLRAAAAALPALGLSHNRWHVRDVLVRILQSVRTSVEAMAALDGLRQASPEALDWAITDFALRSLHPVLRDGTAELLGPTP